MLCDDEVREGKVKKGETRNQTGKIWKFSGRNGGEAKCSGDVNSKLKK